MQERARVEAETDDTWQGDEHEMMDIMSGSSNTPDSVFVDTEVGAEQMLSSNTKSSFMEMGNMMGVSNSGQDLIALGVSTDQPSTSAGAFMPMTPDMKRGRGRPRKKKDLLGLGMYCCPIVFLILPSVADEFSDGLRREKKDSFTSYSLMNFISWCIICHHSSMISIDKWILFLWYLGFMVFSCVRFLSLFLSILFSKSIIDFCSFMLSSFEYSSVYVSFGFRFLYKMSLGAMRI